MNTVQVRPAGVKVYCNGKHDFRLLLVYRGPRGYAVWTANGLAYACSNCGARPA